MGRRLQELQRATRERVDCLHRHLSLQRHLVCSLVEHDHIIVYYCDNNGYLLRAYLNITKNLFFFYHREGSNDIRKLFCMKLVHK